MTSFTEMTNIDGLTKTKKLELFEQTEMDSRVPSDSVRLNYL